jgi:hypothetical protein
VKPLWQPKKKGLPNFRLLAHSKALKLWAKACQLRQGIIGAPCECWEAAIADGWYAKG